MNGWFQNGERVRTAPIDDRALQYGDGLFETIAIRGGAPRLWPLHAARLAAGCRRLAIVPPADEQLLEQLENALRDADADTIRCTAKVIVTAGASKRGYRRARATPNVFIGIFPSEALVPARYRDGVETIICDTRLATGSVTAGLKTLNRLEQVIAAAEVSDQSVFEGLTLDAEDRLICGTMSNVFLVADSSIVTPSLSRCGVAGVMRQHAIDSLRASDMPVSVRDVAAAEILSSDEVFLSNSQFGVLPVCRCGDNAWKAFPVTRAVMSILAANGISDCSP